MGNKSHSTTKKVSLSSRSSKKNKADLMRLKRKLLSRHLWLVRLSFIFLILGVIAFVLVLVYQLLVLFGMDRYINLARAFVFAPKEEISQTSGHTNILILGKAGEGYTAPDLTDTIIVASVSHATNPQVTLFSLPRDIWLADFESKLNSIYYWGNQKEPGGGLVLSKSTIEEIVGIPIHYVAVIDFNNFKKLIDIVGGVDVVVEHGFTDTRFPIPGLEEDLCGGDPEYNCRYETVTFDKGVEHMDGERALKYVRSRHSEDETEGTDFARSRRQQQVLSALKQKLTSKEIILNPFKFKGVWEESMAMLETDLSEGEIAILARSVYEARADIESHTLPEEFLENPEPSREYDNLYVFIPKVSDWSEVHAWVQDLINQ